MVFKLFWKWIAFRDVVLHAVWKTLHHLHNDLEQVKYFCGHVMYLEYHKFAFCIIFIFEMKQDINCYIVVLDDRRTLSARKWIFTSDHLLLYKSFKVMFKIVQSNNDKRSGVFNPKCRMHHFMCLYKTASQIITGTFSLIRNARLSFPSRILFRCFLFLFRTRWNPLLRCGSYKCWAFSQHIEACLQDYFWFMLQLWYCNSVR